MGRRKERINPTELVERAFQNPEFLERMATHIMRVDVHGQALEAYELDEDTRRLPQPEDE